MWFREHFANGTAYQPVTGNDRATGALPAPWADASAWCKADISYRLTNDAAGAFLRIEGKGNGKVQFARPLEQRAAGVAAFRVHLRGRTRTHAGVLLGIRRPDKPEESDSFHAATILEMQKGWRDYTADIRGEFPDGPLSFYVNFGVPADLDLVSLAIEPIPVASYAPPTVVPLKREPAAAEHHAGKDALAAEMQPRVVFFGDSITDGWDDGNGRAVWEKDIAPLRAVNFGIGANRVEHLLWQVEHCGLGTAYRPPVVVVLIGINNVFRIHSLIDIEDGMRKLLGALRAKAPDSRILLLGVFPQGRQPNTARRAEIEELNRRYAAMADGQHISFFDIGGAFLSSEGVLSPEVAHDGTHLMPQGYRLWADNLLPRLQAMLAAPERP